MMAEVASAFEADPADGVITEPNWQSTHSPPPLTITPAPTAQPGYVRAAHYPPHLTMGRMPDIPVGMMPGSPVDNTLGPNIDEVD